MKKISRVVCGMSGGVDSAVSALLLKKKGYEVVGLFMKNWDVADETGRCAADADLQDAELACHALDIPLHQVNFVKEYWHQVFSEMVRDYQKGVTPNPDIMCNKHIKFDAFFRHATQTLDADAISTGHYARTSADYDLDSVDPRKGVQLLKSADSVKDQTFFLSQISQQALQRTIFPVGELRKDVVKRIAVEAGLEKIAKRKESMGICFIGSRQFQRFMEEYVEPKPGNFLDVETGDVVGQHKGIHYWTLGQRANIPGLRRAYFIAEKNAQTNDIIVASGTDHPALFCQTLFTGTPHWICKPPRSLMEEQMVDLDFRFQHKHPLVSCTATLSGGNTLIVSISRPMRAVTPGQYAVFYRGDECLGSAKILRTGPSLFTLSYGERVKNSSEFS
ncbi:mitochondrial tRNA-specific 2-thiouridylase 1-like [Babylonia areolata]|uniref:mitochondrial tRNA-specific 2-thiouridylase 1-like n=1 Tax=Babylonia areolata TaxID=304850 RepID=UPI003FD653B1